MPPKNAQDGLLTGAVETENIALPDPPHIRNPRIHPLLSKQIIDCIQPQPENRPESMEIIKPLDILEVALEIIPPSLILEESLLAVAVCFIR